MHTLKFVRALDLSELPPGKATTATVDGKEIAVFNVDGEIFALDDSCAHAGASLGWGIFEGKIVKCRAHGMRFDVTTGLAVGSATFGVQSYPAKVEGADILIAVGETADN